MRPEVPCGEIPLAFNLPGFELKCEKRTADPVEYDLARGLAANGHGYMLDYVLAWQPLDAETYGLGARANSSLRPPFRGTPPLCSTAGKSNATERVIGVLDQTKECFEFVRYAEPSNNKYRQRLLGDYCAWGVEAIDDATASRVLRAISTR